MLFNVNLLQIKTTPEEYLPFLRIKGYKGLIDELGPDYWEKIPEYILSKCPFCGEVYSEQIDTYNTYKWGEPFSGGEAYLLNEKTVKCSHFYKIHVFLNFNGLPPSISIKEPIKSRTYIPEAPHVIAPFLAEGIDSKAVIHALPICRIEKGKFVPRYTVYMVAYFCPESEVQKIIESRHKYFEGAPDPIAIPDMLFMKNEDIDEWFDLKRWVTKDRLYWLEPNNPELPLKKGLVEEFPFAEIEGRRWPYYEYVPPRVIKKTYW